MFLKKQEQPVAHKVILNEIPCVLQKSFPKYGITIEDDGDSVWLYATNSTFTDIFCALFISVTGCIKDLDVFVVHNAAFRKVGLYFNNQFHAIIDFKSKKACTRSMVGQGSAWGNISFCWDDSMEIGL